MTYNILTALFSQTRFRRQTLTDERKKKHFNQYMEVDKLSESHIGEKGPTNQQILSLT